MNTRPAVSTGMICASGDSTLLLARHVRDRGDLTLEDAVHQLTGRPAGLFRLGRRGVIEAGAIADLTVPVPAPTVHVIGGRERAGVDQAGRHGGERCVDRRRDRDGVRALTGPGGGERHDDG